MVVRRLDLEERVDLDNVEGTSEASLAASVPRVSTDALPTQEPGPGPGRTHGGLRGWNRDGGSNKRMLLVRPVRLFEVLKCSFLWEGGNPVS